MSGGHTKVKKKRQKLLFLFCLCEKNLSEKKRGNPRERDLSKNSFFSHPRQTKKKSFKFIASLLDDDDDDEERAKGTAETALSHPGASEEEASR